jgi:hypothetical protein
MQSGTTITLLAGVDGAGANPFGRAAVLEVKVKTITTLLLRSMLYPLKMYENREGNCVKNVKVMFLLNDHRLH